MNKKFHPIRAFIIIFILSLLIILPPLFRLMFPKTEEAKSKNNNKIKLLTCTRNYIEEQTTTKVEIRYINAKVNQTKITYTLMPDTQLKEAAVMDGDILPSMELSYFQSLQGTHITQTDTKTVIIINQDTINKNPDNQDLKENYFNDKLISQKIYFTNRYYECSESNA